MAENTHRITAQEGDSAHTHSWSTEDTSPASKSGAPKIPVRRGGRSIKNNRWWERIDGDGRSRGGTTIKRYGERKYLFSNGGYLIAPDDFDGELPDWCCWASCHNCSSAIARKGEGESGCTVCCKKHAFRFKDYENGKCSDWQPKKKPEDEVLPFEHPSNPAYNPKEKDCEDCWWCSALGCLNPANPNNAAVCDGKRLWEPKEDK